MLDLAAITMEINRLTRDRWHPLANLTADHLGAHLEVTARLQLPDGRVVTSQTSIFPDDTFLPLSDTDKAALIVERFAYPWGRKAA